MTLYYIQLYLIKIIKKTLKKKAKASVDSIQKRKVKDNNKRYNKHKKPRK